ncbi:MAG: helix-turn-helix transcriptional regulator [Balneola sp.]
MNQSLPYLIQPLKVARALQRITQQELAKASGITNVTISYIENGVVRPNKTTRAKIERVVGAVDWERTFSEGMVHRKTGDHYG